jgi:NifU-like protein involved in Fe-S cluster formation
MTKELHGKTYEEAEKIIENFDRMINELPYDEDCLGELNIYNEVYKQPSRKKCALLPIKAIQKIIDEEK